MKTKSKKKWVKHVIKKGARYHVISYFGGRDWAERRCSEPNCEINRRNTHV